MTGVLALLAAVAGMAIPATTQATRPSAPAARLVVFGHSWAAERYPDPQITPWPDRVARAQGVGLDNEAVGGTEASQTAATVAAYRPRSGDEVVVEALLNDVRKYGRSGLPRFRQALRRILAHLTERARPPRVLLVVDPPIRAWHGYPGYERGSDTTLRRYGRALRRVARRYGEQRVAVANLRRGWSKARFLAADGVHPNDAGTRRVARRIARALRR